MQSLIEFTNVTLGYGSNIVLKDISFSINDGDYFGLVGPNGAGKTTLLRAILGTLKPLSGTMRVGGAGDGIRFGYVPQRDTVDYVMPYTVEEVVMMGRYRQLGLIRRPTGNDRAVVAESLRHVDIDDLRHLAFKDLSGGQKQRTLIARALASKPAILILDEPTNGMDLPSRNSILGLIHTLHIQDKLTVIMVSHLLDDVANYVKRIALVERKFFQVGDVDEILTAANLSALYEMNVTVNAVAGGKVIRASGESRKGVIDGNR
ncbi:MAG: metal ABC transporter ATP-binding protein [Ignavibacteriae bacterium]|nr:metal ABC transporter ATP-binding protein [Ignavibacteriota bacterium]